MMHFELLLITLDVFNFVDRLRPGAGGPVVSVNAQKLAHFLFLITSDSMWSLTSISPLSVISIIPYVSSVSVLSATVSS